MLEWLIETVANLLGISPLTAVGLLAVGSVVVSAALRWHRRVRQEEYVYLEMTQSAPPLDARGYADPQRYGQEVLQASREAARGRLRRRSSVERARARLLRELPEPESEPARPRGT